MMSFISPDIARLSLDELMREALAEAEGAGQAGEVPIGAERLHAGHPLHNGRAVSTLPGCRCNGRHSAHHFCFA